MNPASMKPGAIQSDPSNAQSLMLLGAFATPLMVSLARRIYSDTSEDPMELLDCDRFPTAASLSDYLFDQFIRVTYDQPLQDQIYESAGRWQSDAAQYRLAYFAACLYYHDRHYPQLEVIVEKIELKFAIRAPLPLFVKRSLVRLDPTDGVVVKNDLPTLARFLWPTSKFLEDAYRRGVLRRSGKKYEFRHALLKDRLAYRLFSEHGWIFMKKFTRRVINNLAIQLFKSGRFKEAETLLRTRLGPLLNPPWRRYGPFRMMPAEWSIEYTENSVHWKLEVADGDTESCRVRIREPVV